MRRPLVIVALTYAAGLLLAECMQPPLPWLFGLGFLLIFLAVLWKHSSRWWVLVPLIAAVGWANLVSRTAVLSQFDLRVILTPDPSDVVVRGKVTATPLVRMFMRDEEESFRSLAVIETTAIRLGTNWVETRGLVMSATPGDLSSMAHAGARVELRGVIGEPAGPVAPGLFDYRAYLARQGVYFQLKVESSNAWTIIEPTAPPVSDRFVRWSQGTLARGLPEQDEPLKLLFAMTLGWKTGLTSDVYEPFMESGTMHIFAVSGLHIALIAGLLVALMRVLRIPRTWCGVVVIPLIWFYTAATGWQPSAIRSVIMMSIIIGGWSLGRPADLLNSLAAAAMIILVWEPRQLFQASFQLSFFVVLSIALLMPPLQQLGDRLIAHDPLLPREVLPRWRRILNTFLRWLVAGFATSLAAWLGSLPLTIYYFHIFSPVTLLANLLIVPMSSAALASSLGSLLCGDWLPWAGELFNHGAWFWMSLMMRTSNWATTVPGAFCHVASPPTWVFAIYYAVLIGALSGWLFHQANRRWALSLGVVLIALTGWGWRASQGRVRITVLPLNGGHAALVDAPGTDDDWLVDCGSTNSVEFVTKPFLHSQGFDRLPRLALTHGALQDMGGARLLMDEFQIDRILASPVRFRSVVYRDVLDAVSVIPDRLQNVGRGDVLEGWTVLHPAADDKFSQADDGSLVLRGEVFGSRVLLLGDLGRPGQEALMRSGQDVRADIVVTGLPEETEPLCNGLIKAVNPGLIIVTDSEFPATKRAGMTLRKRLARSGIPVLYTREAGAVSLLIDQAGWTVMTR